MTDNLRDLFEGALKEALIGKRIQPEDFDDVLTTWPKGITEGTIESVIYATRHVVNLSIGFKDPNKSQREIRDQYIPLSPSQFF